MSSTCCPKCNASPVYVPFLGTKIECSNPFCELYSQDAFPYKTSKDSEQYDNEEDYRGADADDQTDPARDQQALDNLLDTMDTIFPDDPTCGDAGVDETQNHPVYLWSTRHNDFGD